MPRLACVATALLSVLTGIASAEDDMALVGYFPQWGMYWRKYYVTNIPAEKLTHVIYAFAKPVYDSSSDSGSLVPGDTNADLVFSYPGDTTNQPYRGHFWQIGKLKQRFPHLRVLISAGGSRFSTNFSDIAATAHARDTFVESSASFVTNYDFDGIDVDWEFPVEGGAAGTVHRPDDAVNYVSLVQALRSRLEELQPTNSRPYLLTVASACAYSTVANQFRLAEMAVYVDWFNVMTYYYNGAWNPVTGHNAPLYANPAAPVPDFNVDKTVRTYLEQGVPARKIVLGIPFFGIGFQDVTNQLGLFEAHGGASTTGTWQAGVYDYRDLVEGIRSNNFINSKGFVRHWDDISQVPYLYNPTSHVWISYDDPESVRLKVQYAASNGLGGVMYWSMDADAGDYALERACHGTGYPFRLSSTMPGQAEIDMSWYALTGQTYAVDCQTSLLTNRWQACQSLVNESNVPSNPVVGRNRRVTLTDTNLPALDRRFYRITGATTAVP